MGLRRAAGRYVANSRQVGLRSSGRMLLHDWAIRAPVRRPVMRLRPRYLQIEVTTVCNLLCTFCPRTTVMVPQEEKPVRHMSLTEFRRVIDQVSFAWKVQLQGYGEPLLNPDILEMIRYARSRGIAVQMNTNCTRWPEGGAEGLIESGITGVIVSVDGATPGIFEAGRIGAKFDVVIGNLRQLVEARRRLGRRLPFIETATVVMPHNAHEMPDVLRLLTEIGVDHCNFQLERSYKGKWVRKAQAAFATSAAKTAISVDVSEEPAMRSGPKTPCPWPWRGAFITVDGFVTACCEYPGTVASRHNFGNILQQPFSEIWNGAAYREFRRQLIEGTAPRICVGCPAAPGR